LPGANPVQAARDVERRWGEPVERYRIGWPGQQLGEIVPWALLERLAVGLGYDLGRRVTDECDRRLLVAGCLRAWLEGEPLPPS